MCSVDSALWWTVAWGVEVVQKETVDVAQYCRGRTGATQADSTAQSGDMVDQHMVSSSARGSGKYISTCNAVWCNG